MQATDLWNLDDDDVIPTAVVTAIAVIWCGRWARHVLRVFAPRATIAIRLTLLAAASMVPVTVFVALGIIADEKVRESVGYRVLFTATAGLSLLAMFGVLRVFGLGPLRAAVLQANPAAAGVAIAVAAAVAMLNIGANIGTGDTILSTFVPVAFGCGELTLYLAGLAWATALPEAVASGRSPAAAWRLGALTMGGALPVAQQASGDWVSAPKTIGAMTLAVPVLIVLVVLAMSVERYWPATAPGEERGGWSRGPWPAAGFAAAAVFLTWAMLRR